MFKISIENLDTGEKVEWTVNELRPEYEVDFEEQFDPINEELSETEKAVRKMPEDVRSSPNLILVLNMWEGRPMSPHTIQAIINEVRHRDRKDAGLR